MLEHNLQLSGKMILYVDTIDINNLNVAFDVLLLPSQQFKRGVEIHNRSWNTQFSNCYGKVLGPHGMVCVQTSIFRIRKAFVCKCFLRNV